MEPEQPQQQTEPPVRLQNALLSALMPRVVGHTSSKNPAFVVQRKSQLHSTECSAAAHPAELRFPCLAAYVAAPAHQRQLVSAGAAASRAHGRLHFIRLSADIWHGGPADGSAAQLAAAGHGDGNGRLAVRKSMRTPRFTLPPYACNARCTRLPSCDDGGKYLLLVNCCFLPFADVPCRRRMAWISLGFCTRWTRRILTRSSRKLRYLQR